MPTKNVSKPKEVNVKGVDMPHNLEAEQALLGCIMLDSEIQLDVITKLDAGDFYADSHKYIFEAMRDICNQNLPVDFVTLTDKLESDGNLESAGGIAYLTNLTKIMPSSANYMHYLDIVLRDGTLRKLIKGSAEVILEAQSSQDKQSALAFAEKTVFDLSSQMDNGSMVKINAVLPEVINKFDKISKDKNAFKGIPTKFKRLDFLLNGLHDSDLILVAARPAMGKTSFAMNIVENVATSSDKVCAVFSLEMGKEQLTQRMLCSIAEVSMQDALKGDLTKEQWLRLASAREKLSKAKIYIDDSTLITPAEMLSKCRRLQRKYGLDLIMIDYIQLMSSGSKNTDSRQQEVAEISRNLKILAKELNVPVIVLSQLSRSVESRTDHRPQLSDMRDSGAIEQDADIVMFIHRPEYYATPQELAEGKVQPNIAEIIIAKHRNGPTDTVKLFFRGECTKFMNIEENKQDFNPDVAVGGGNHDADVASGYNEEPAYADAPIPDEPPFEDDGEEYSYNDEPKSPDEEIFG